MEPTAIHVPDAVLDDLRARLALTRAPLKEGNGDWSYGFADCYLRELVAYWRDGYDWRMAEAAMNAYEHYQVNVAGVPVHFMRKPGRGPRPVALILTAVPPDLRSRQLEGGPSLAWWIRPAKHRCPPLLEAEVWVQGLGVLDGFLARDR